MSNVAAGKDIDDEGEQLNDVEKALNRQGIALRSAKNEWRSFEDVLDEIAKKWKNGNFNEIQKSQIATAIAGTRQQENFRAMMNNWDEVERLTKVASESTGSATKRMEIYLDSVEAKTNNLKAAWEQFVMSLNQSDSWKQLLDMLTNFLDKLQYVDWKKVGEVLTIFGALFVGAKIVKGVASLIKLINVIKKAKIAGDMTKVFSLSSGLVSKLLLIAGAITAIVVAINSVKNNFDNQIKDIDKRVESINKEKQAVEEDKKSVQDLYAEYQKLSSKQQLSGLDTTEKKRMAQITKDLVEQYGFEYTAVDSLNGGYVLATDALTKYNEAKEKQLKQLNEEERLERIKKVATQAKKQEKNISSQKASKKGETSKFNFLEFENNQLFDEIDTFGFLGSLKAEWNAYKAAFGGTGNFWDDYNAEMQRQFKEKTGEIETEITNGWNELSSYTVEALAPAIENSGLSDRFTELLSAQMKAGVKNIDPSKLATTEDAEKLILSYEKLLSQPEIKDYSDQLDKKLTEFEKKIANKSSKMTLEDYKNYNEALEKQASLSITLLSNMIGLDKAKDIVTKSLNQQMSNTGSYFALLSDQIKKDFGDDSQIVKNFDNIAGSIININKQLADGQIDVKNYFNLMKSEIDSIDLSNIEESFGNIGNYLATMGQISNSAGGQIQSIIGEMQQGKKLNNEGVDDIKSFVGILGRVQDSAKRNMTDENGQYKIFKDSSGNDYDSKILFEDTSATDNNKINELNQKRTEIQNKINTAEQIIQAANQIKNGEEVNITSPQTVQKSNKDYGYRNVQPSVLKKSPIDEILGNDPVILSNPVNTTSINPTNNPLDPSKNLVVETKITQEKEKQVNIDEKIEHAQKQLAKYKEEEASLTEDINKEQTKVNKGMNSYLSDMEKGVSYLDSFDWDSLDKASDTIFQGFSDGAFDANSTIDNVEEKYKNAALEMANAFVDMTNDSNNAFTSLGENVQTQLKNISKETLEQIGLTSEATNVEIANAMLQSQSNFNAVVGAMNKNAQTALSEVLKGAGGMLEALGTAIESFTGEIKISIGGIKFNGLKTFATWDGGELFSSSGKPVETSISFNGSGIDTKSLGKGIKDAGTALKNNADTLAAQWTPIQPNLTNKNGNNGANGGKNSGGGGSKKGSGDSYTPEEAEKDKKSILNDIEDYERDIEADLEDQTEQLVNHYNLERNKLETLREELDYYDAIYDSTENTTKWLETQLDILDEESKKISEMQQSNEKIDAQRKKIYAENKQYNVESWFDSEGNDTLAYGDMLNSFEYKKEAIQKEVAQKMRAEYNRIANSTDKDAIKDAKEKIKLIEEEGDLRIKELEKEKERIENIHDSVETLNDAWDENQEKIRESLQELNDRIKSIRDELIDDLMEQLERATDKMNKSLESNATRLEQLKQVQESYNSLLNDTLDTQDELMDELQANLDSYQYLDEDMRQLMFNEDDYKKLSGVLGDIQEDIAGIWEDHYSQISNLSEDEMYKAQYITAETERQLAAKQKEYDLARAELDIAKAKTNLENVKNERNTRIFANGQWQWVADPTAVRDAQKALADQERAKNKIEREAEQQELIDSLDRLIDSDNLQIDENNDLLEKIQEAIEQETEEVKSIDQALENIKNANLPEINTTLINALGKDGGHMTELLKNINKNQTSLAAALRGQTIEQAEKQLKSGTMDKKAFEELVTRLGYSFNESTGKITTQDGSFDAHYAGWTKKPNNDIQTGTANNGVQVTGGNGGQQQHSPSSTIDSVANKNSQEALKQIAREVWLGKWGNGQDRKNRLTAAGYDYAAVQALVNKGRKYFFDQGGVSTGIGLMPKDTLEPERVLSPRQTKSFDNLVNNLTTNPVLSALSRNPSVVSNLTNMGGTTSSDKNYYFSNFTIQSDDIGQFISSIETMIPMKNN